MVTTIVLGAATRGGGFPLYGGAPADTVNETDPALHVEPRNTKGSTENIPLLETGELDIALVTGEPFYEAVEGIGRARSDLKIVAAMYSTAGMFIVRGDSPARTIADLKGKPVAFGTEGSGLTILSRYVMEGLGLDQQKDFQAIFLDKAGDGPAMVMDGRAAALWGGGWPGLPHWRKKAAASSRRARKNPLACAPGAASSKAPLCPPPAMPGRRRRSSRSARGALRWPSLRSATTSPMRSPARSTRRKRPRRGIRLPRRRAQRSFIRV